jgi:hypothetical protein
MGPRDQVLVGDGAGGVVTHRRDAVEPYTDEVGREILANMNRQKFEEVVEPELAAGNATDEQPVPVEPAQEAQGGSTAASEGEAKAKAAPEGEGGTAPGSGPDGGKKGGKAKAKGQGK